MQITQGDLPLLASDLNLVDGDIAHHLRYAPGLGLQESTNASRGPLGDEHDSRPSHDSPDKVLFAGVGHGLLGDDPAPLNLLQRHLHGPRRVLDLGEKRAARQEGEKREHGGDRGHNADDQPADP